MAEMHYMYIKFQPGLRLKPPPPWRAHGAPSLITP